MLAINVDCGFATVLSKEGKGACYIITKRKSFIWVPLLLQSDILENNIMIVTRNPGTVLRFI
jgi:hypothetical protein